MNDRNFYERRLGNPGYDAVARKKIKELEKAVGGGSGGGLDMVIQCSSDTGMINESPTFTILSGDYESLKTILTSGGKRANVMMYFPWSYGGITAHEQFTPCDVFYFDNGNYGSPSINFIFDVSYAGNHSASCDYLRIVLGSDGTITHYLNYGNPT